jgi:hypothetical protein
MGLSLKTVPYFYFFTSLCEELSQQFSAKETYGIVKSQYLKMV